MKYLYMEHFKTSDVFNKQESNVEIIIDQKFYIVVHIQYSKQGYFAHKMINMVNKK